MREILSFLGTLMCVPHFQDSQRSRIAEGRRAARQRRQDAHE